MHRLGLAPARGHQDLIARAGHVGFRQEKAKECQHLSSDRGPVDVTFTDVDRYPVLVLDHLPVRELVARAGDQGRRPGSLRWRLRIVTKTLDVRNDRQWTQVTLPPPSPRRCQPEATAISKNESPSAGMEASCLRDYCEVLLRQVHRVVDQPSRPRASRSRAQRRQRSKSTEPNSAKRIHKTQSVVRRCASI